MKNLLVIDHGPFTGFTPGDFRCWLSEHTQEGDIALAMKYVSEKASILLAYSDFTYDSWMDYAIDEWDELLLELVEQIKSILSHDNRTDNTGYQLDGKGWYYIIKPFMERNGYRDGNGWWIEKSREK